MTGIKKLTTDPQMVRLLLVFCVLPLFLASGCERGTSDNPRAIVEKSEPVQDGAVSESISPGKPAPPIRLPDTKRVPRALADFRGKLVLLNFWATWCAPCVAEMPALERLYKTHHDKGFEVVAVALEQGGLEDVRQFVEKKGLSFTVLVDEQAEAGEAYGISGLPESFFIDQDGNFLSFLDPQRQHEITRIISDQPWDSKAYIGAIAELLESKRNDSNTTTTRSDSDS